MREEEIVFDEEYFRSHGKGSSYGREYWHGSQRILQWFSRRLKLISDKIIKSKVVVDLGCGLAHSAHAIRMINPRLLVIAIDISEVALKRAKELYGDDEQLLFIVADAGNIPLRDNIADVVMSFETYEHLENPVKMLKEAHRILREGGTLLVSTPNARSLPAIIYGDKWIGLSDDTHINLTTPEQLKKNLLKSGFNIVKCFTHGFPILNSIEKIFNKLLIRSPLGLGAEIICIAIKDPIPT